MGYVPLSLGCRIRFGYHGSLSTRGSINVVYTSERDSELE